MPRGSLVETRHYYYNDQWQVVEERVGADGDSARVDAQYVWHPHYVDALAMRYWDSDATGGPDTRHYYLQDANYNVTALVDAGGDAVERYHYTPYGEVTFLNAADFSVKGTQVSAVKNVNLYTGRERDPETGLQLNRQRYYAAHLGRWVSRDPISYIGGLNLFGYVGNRPGYYVDPDGLEQYHPTVPPGRLPSDPGAGPGTKYCCNGTIVDPGTHCCVPNSTKPMSGQTPDPPLFVYGNNEKTSCKVCWRKAQLPGGGVGAAFGAYHMWLKCDFGEVGLGEQGGAVPGAGPGGSPPMYPPTGVNDHTGESIAPGSKCKDVDVPACCMGRQMEPRPTNESCGPRYNCNTYVSDSLRACGVTPNVIRDIWDEVSDGSIPRIWGSYEWIQY